MITTKSTLRLLGLGLAATLAAACTDAGLVDNGDAYDADPDGKADTAAAAAPVVSDDNLNGQWAATTNGTTGDDLVIESWTAIGIKLHVGPKTYTLTRTGLQLSGDGVALIINPHKAGVRDDTMDGTIAGAKVHLDRDVDVQDPITLAFPGDRPFRVYLTDTIAPAAQRDRESYAHATFGDMTKFLYSCELYKHGSWLRYLKGATWAEQQASFKKIISSVSGVESSPRQLIGNVRFQNAVKGVLKDQTQVGLVLSSFSMYFSTAMGRALRMPLTPTSSAYFITDRPTRAEKIGLVVMDTPTHGPLASTFGRQLLDMGAMPATDSPLYVRAMMGLLAKSDSAGAAKLSGVGQSALTDWYAVMAIEDYRGVAFGSASLGWGYNMTNVQFYGLLVRALAHPTTKDSAGNPVLGQVIVGSELRPGDPSYADVLNGGNDMQEYPDMAQLKTLTSAWLRAKHADKIAAVEKAFAAVAPKAALDYRAQGDVFHYITSELYNANVGVLTGAAADTASAAVADLFDTMSSDAAGLEAYLLANGITKSNTPAAKSTGF
jgi:hypothetical protein